MSETTIPAHLVIRIIEEENSDRIELHLKNNFTIKAFKTQFKDYEQYKRNIASNNSR
jgi:hypothetical protein